MGIWSKLTKTPPPASLPPVPPRVTDPELSSAERRLLVTLQNDIEGGAAFQAALLPKDLTVPGYDLALHSEGARKISGDACDLLPLPDGRTGLFVGDASGKGVPAALLSITTAALVRTLCRAGAPPSRVLGLVNRMLSGWIQRGMFITGVYAVLDPSKNTLCLANAGHLPTVVWRHATNTIELYERHGAALGVLAPEKFDATATEETVTLEPGDRFVVITDGLNEAMAPGNRQFGMEHLRKRLLADGGQESNVFLGRLLEELEIHVSGCAPSDDLTLLTGRRIEA